MQVTSSRTILINGGSEQIRATGRWLCLQHAGRLLGGRLVIRTNWQWCPCCRASWPLLYSWPSSYPTTGWKFNRGLRGIFFQKRKWKEKNGHHPSHPSSRNGSIWCSLDAKCASGSWGQKHGTSGWQITVGRGALQPAGTFGPWCIAPWLVVYCCIEHTPSCLPLMHSSAQPSL